VAPPSAEPKKSSNETVPSLVCPGAGTVGGFVGPSFAETGPGEAGEPEFPVGRDANSALKKEATDCPLVSLAAKD
jgi:hypothetical protein